MRKDTLLPPLDASEVAPVNLVKLRDGILSRTVRPEEAAAISRLIRIAQGDSGQSRPVADFLLACGTPAVAAAST